MATRRVYPVLSDARACLYDSLLEPVHLGAQISTEFLCGRQSLVEPLHRGVAVSQAMLAFLLDRPQLRLQTVCSVRSATDWNISV